MSLNAQKGEKKQHPIAPVGAHAAICFSITDWGTHMKSFAGKEPKATSLVHFGWEFPNLPQVVFDETKGPQNLAIFQEYTTSLAEKSKLFAMLSAWRGVPPVDLAKELPNFLGQACLINVVHNPHKVVPNIMYANISGNGTGIMRMPQGMPIGQGKNPKTLFNLDTYSHTEFIKLPEWIQEKIQSSLEWSGIVAKYGQPPVTAQPTQSFQQPVQNTTAINTQPVQPIINNPFDDTPPF